MKISKILIITVLFGFFTHQVNAQGKNSALFVNNSALIGDYVATNPGFETIVPYWYPLPNYSVKFRFDVYKTGTNTKLFSTPEKTFTNVRAGMYDQSPDFKRIGNTVILSVTPPDYFQGYIYAVDLSASGKSPWIKTFSQFKDIVTGILPDMNGNGVGELLVTTYKLNEVPDRETIDTSVYIYDGKTGVSLATPKTYEVQR